VVVAVASAVVAEGLVPAAVVVAAHDRVGDIHPVDVRRDSSVVVAGVVDRVVEGADGGRLTWDRCREGLRMPVREGFSPPL